MRFFKKHRDVWNLPYENNNHQNQEELSDTHLKEGRDRSIEKRHGTLVTARIFERDMF